MAVESGKTLLTPEQALPLAEEIQARRERLHVRVENLGALIGWPPENILRAKRKVDEMCNERLDEIERRVDWS